MKMSRGSRPWCTTISIFKGATRLPCQRLLLEVSCVRCTILTSGMRSRAHPSFLFHSYSDPYNGYRFPFDVSDLALLDEKHTELALNIMRLRSLGHEPHNFFHNGGQLFEDMAAAW